MDRQSLAMAEGTFKEFKNPLEGQILGVFTRERDGWDGAAIWEIKKKKNNLETTLHTNKKKKIH